MGPITSLLIFGFLSYVMVVERKIVMGIIEDVFHMLDEMLWLIWHRPIVVLCTVLFILFLVWWWSLLP